MTGRVSTDQQTVRILLVDSDLDFLERTAFALEWSGHTVVKTLSGVDAAAKFADQNFDVVITAMFMPEMDGFELMRELRRISSKVKIIVLVGNGHFKHESYISRAVISLGAAAVADKSISYTELNRVIADVVI